MWVLGDKAPQSGFSLIWLNLLNTFSLHLIRILKLNVGWSSYGERGRNFPEGRQFPGVHLGKFSSLIQMAMHWRRQVQMSRIASRWRLLMMVIYLQECLLSNH